MKRLFLDTGVLVGASSSGDRFHEASAGLLERIGSGEWTGVHTSDFVLAEALNFIARKIKRKASAEVVLGLLFGTGQDGPWVTSVVRIHGGRLAAALNEYQNRFEAGLSLTDWSSIVAMRELGIDEIATFDRGLRGFVSTVP